MPPSSAQGSSAGHSAPRSPIPAGIAQQGPGSESGGSADSIAVEPSSSGADISMDVDQGRILLASGVSYTLYH